MSEGRFRASFVEKIRRKTTIHKCTLPSFLEFVKVEYKNTCIRNQKLSNMCHPVKYILAVINQMFQGSWEYFRNIWYGIAYGATLQ